MSPSWGLTDLATTGLNTAEFVRQHLDQLGLSAELEEVGWPHTAKFHLPPSRLNRLQGTATDQLTGLIAAG